MSNFKRSIKKVSYRIFKSKIFIFHHLTDNPSIDVSGCKIDTESFYKFVESQHKTVSVTDILEKNGLGLSNKSAITFDDGIEDVYTVAYPYLKERGIPFTIFIVVDFIGKEGYLSMEQLAELAKDKLVSVGSHGMSHEVFTKLSEAQRKNELAESKKILEKIIGKEVNLFAFSHGQYTKADLPLLKESGYKYAFTTDEISCSKLILKSPYEVPRFNVDSSTKDNYI